jgi:hypothetical protein
MQHANCQMQGEAELAVPAPRSCRNRAHELSAALVSCRLEFLRPMIGAPADPPFNNYQAFHSNYAGLKILADTVREHERQYAATDPYAEHVVLHAFTSVPSVVSCAFNWFTTTFVNYLRVVALVDLMATRKWKSVALVDPRNHRDVKTHWTDFVRKAVPEVYRWRNKVAAHFAATDPFRDDNLGTIEQSIMNPVSYRYPHYTWARGS